MRQVSVRAYGDGQAGELNDKLARGAKGEGFGAAGLAHSGGLTVLGLPDQSAPLPRLTHFRRLHALSSSGVVR